MELAYRQGSKPAAGRTVVVVIVAFTAFSLLCAWLMLPSPPLGLYWDDAWYALMAEWYSNRGEQDDFLQLMLQSRQYPPLYPFILSFAGDVLVNADSAAMLNAVFLGMAASLSMAWLIREKVPVFAAFLASSLLIFLPVALDQLAYLLSEYLFLLLTTLVLLLCRCDSTSSYKWMLIGALTGLCIATRSTGWMLALAIPCALAAGRNFHNFLYYLPGLVTGLLLMFYLSLGLPSSPGYISIFMQEIEASGVSYIFSQAGSLINGWIGLWDNIPTSLVAGILVIPGLYLRLLKNRVDAWYAIFSLVLIAAWPFPGQYPRLLWALLPALLVAMFSAIQVLKIDRYRYPVLFTITLFFLATNFENGIGRTVGRLLNAPRIESMELSRTREWTRIPNEDDAISRVSVIKQVMLDISTIKDTVEPGSCVYSNFASIVAANALLPSFLPDWGQDQLLDSGSIRCKYYYSIPSAKFYISPKQMKNSALSFEEIFQSSTLAHGKNDFAVGIFYRLEHTRE